MAAKAFLIAVAVVAAIVAPAIAKEIVVGDDQGWTLNFDYKKWAEGKQFYVGDTLVFNYPADKHTVVKANMTEFQQCTPAQNATVLKSGSDKIVLASPGKKWYICTVPNHCQNGPMKLAINVWPVGYAPAPSPTTGAAYGILPSSLMIAALVSLVAAILA